MSSLLVTSSSPHIHSGAGVPRIMLDVIIALTPCVVAALVFFSAWRVALLIAVCVGAAVLTEWLCRRAMRRANTIGDFSAALTGLLLALTLPAGLPLWQAALGSVFAIAIAKQVFGGLGYNPFNPALAGRAFLLISFTAAMTTWNESAWQGRDSATADETQAVAMTTATPLGEMKTKTKSGGAATDGVQYDARLREKLLLGNINGSVGETSAIAILLGFAYLLARRVITWHTTVGYMGAVAGFALCLNAACPRLAMPVDFHLLAGGALFGAVFMATDMVTSPVTKWGRLIFGVGCGLITMLIRVVPNGAYPEGVTFAILIMNAFTPLINKATRYRRFGAAR